LFGPERAGTVSLVRVGKWVCAYHLLRYHYHRLDCESSIAVIEQVLQGGPQEVDHQDVVETLLAEVIDIRDSSYRSISEQVLPQGTYDILTAANEYFVCSILVS
jgi:hypothetical protein